MYNLYNKTRDQSEKNDNKTLHQFRNNLLEPIVECSRQSSRQSAYHHQVYASESVSNAKINLLGASCGLNVTLLMAGGRRVCRPAYKRKAQLSQTAHGTDKRLLMAIKSVSQCPLMLKKLMIIK